ncbi:RDD family protein [Porticoccus sp. W117]|uniref:RDD family protein n=1 Tax=Porticoccus sp. W117 TaxID=3054777 RepID=UPI00259164FC|nr:RDD family protein [Porticoccus sp. W117]MDM3870335.1 RDD family protein [Porticoccus sp. W117]
MTPEEFSTLPKASIFRRLAALVYDFLLMLAIVFICGVLAVIIQYLIYSPIPEGQQMPPLPWVPVVTALWFANAWYFVYCWQKRGQTLAMKAWRMRLQQPNGSLTTTKQRWLRALIAPLSLASVIGLLWKLWDKNGDCLHDKLTGTRVVLLPKGVN